MDIVLIVLWDIVIHYKRKVVYLKTACGDICCNKDACLSFLELIKGPLPLILGKITRKIVSVVAVVSEPCTELFCHVLAVCEHQCKLGLILSKKLQKKLELLGLCHVV